MSDIPAISTQNVPATGQDVGRADGNVFGGGKRGEDRRCGDGVVKCGTVSVVVGADIAVESIVFEVREAPDGAWQGDVAWGAWETKGDDILADGRRHIHGTFRNWSENHSRDIRLRVS